MTKTIHVKYTNEYGNLTIKPVGDFVPHKEFESVYHDKKIIFCISLDDAEKIALITGNDGIQIAFKYPNLNYAYIVMYDENGNLSLANIVSFYFKDNIDATKELERLNKIKAAS